jgi:hypothetical protein
MSIKRVCKSKLSYLVCARLVGGWLEVDANLSVLGNKDTWKILLI